MKQTIFLLLALLIVATNTKPNIKKILTNYSIYAFLEYLHENDYYDLIYWAKCQYGDDIAIGLCQDLVSSVFCEQAVIVYMPSCPAYSPPVEVKDFFSEPKNVQILKKDFTELEIETIVKKTDLKVQKKRKNQKELQEKTK